jgi:hypothetical protein
MRVLIFFFLALTISGVARSQSIAFVVYYTKGNITKAGSAGLVKRGDKLYAKDNITLSQNAQIILVCKNSETVKLTSKGKHAVSTLVKECDKKNPSFINSYFSYVWKEFTTPHGDMEEDPTHYMKNTGAASRGCNTVETKLLLDTVILPLYKPGNARSFPVLFMTTFEQPFLSRFSGPEEGDSMWQVPLDKHRFSMDLLSQEARGPGLYYWQITGKEERGCEPNVLKILPEKEYNATITRLLADLPTASAAETAFMKGFILEENHFTGEAFRYYEQAYKLAPKTEKYKLARSRFYE